MASSVVAYAVASCRALGALLPLLLSTRRIFCCETGWPSVGSRPKQDGTGASSEAPRWVRASFQVRFGSSGLPWAALTIRSLVSSAPPVVGGSETLVVGAGPTDPGVSTGGGEVSRPSPRRSTAYPIARPSTTTAAITPMARAQRARSPIGRLSSASSKSSMSSGPEGPDGAERPRAVEPDRVRIVVVSSPVRRVRGAKVKDRIAVSSLPTSFASGRGGATGGWADPPLTAGAGGISVRLGMGSGR